MQQWAAHNTRGQHFSAYVAENGWNPPLSVYSAHSIIQQRDLWSMKELSNVICDQWKTLDLNPYIYSQGNSIPARWHSELWDSLWNSPSSLKTGVLMRYCRVFLSLSNGHAANRHDRNSLTCFANSQNFCAKKIQINSLTGSFFLPVLPMCLH